MVIRTYMSITTLNVNGLNSPIKRQRLAEWTFFLKMHLSAANKRLTSDVRTHTHWKLRDRKLYFMEMEIKRKLG